VVCWQPLRTVPLVSSKKLLSIGYEGFTIDELVDLLRAEGVTTLVDVRLSAISRKPGLSKAKLSATLEAHGIHYVHLPALGNPRSNRDAFRTGIPADGCVVFEELLDTPAAKISMIRLGSFVVRGTVAIMCMEREHGRCHRQVITRRVAESVDPDINVVRVASPRPKAAKA
jgi:uncharacterized protein (DUF488 family)